MLRKLACGRGLSSFSVFYSTENSDYDFMSVKKHNQWLIEFGFVPNGKRKIEITEKENLFNVMFTDFFNEHHLPKDLHITINGVVGGMMKSFCKMYKYKIVHKSHTQATESAPMDKNIFVLHKRS